MWARSAFTSSRWDYWASDSRYHLESGLSCTSDSRPELCLCFDGPEEEELMAHETDVAAHAVKADPSELVYDHTQKWLRFSEQAGSPR